MGKGRSCLHFPSAAASRRALTWEGAAEAMPARMSRCCLPKVSSSPYKVIWKGKYFPSNLGGWSGSIFRPARVCEGEPCLAFALICCLTGNVPSLCFTRGCGTAMRHPGGLAGNQAGVHRFVWSWLGLPAQAPVLSVELIFAFSSPLNFSKEVTALLAWGVIYLCVCVDTKGRPARAS